MAASASRRAPTASDREAGALFRAARERANLSTKEAARRSDYSEDSIYRIERGEVWPPYASLQRLAAAYGIAPGDFFPNSAASAELEMVEPLFAAMRGLSNAQQAELIHQLATQVRMMKGFMRSTEEPPAARRPVAEAEEGERLGMLPVHVSQ